MEEVNNLSEDGKMKVVKAFLQKGSQEIHKRCLTKGCLNKIGENQQKIRCCGLRLKRIPGIIRLMGWEELETFKTFIEMSSRAVKWKLTTKFEED